MSAQHAPLTKQPRRPGRPKHDSATNREVLLDTAEQMFATLGVEGASMRAISMAAGLTHTAVNYHYRTKPLLLAAVLRRRGEEVGRRFAERLQELEDTGRKPTAQELVQALLVPHVDVIRHDPVGGLHWLRIVARLLLERDPHLVGYLPAGLRICLWRLLQRTYPRVPMLYCRRFGRFARRPWCRCGQHRCRDRANFGPVKIGSDHHVCRRSGQVRGVWFCRTRGGPSTHEGPYNIRPGYLAKTVPPFAPCGPSQWHGPAHLTCCGPASRSRPWQPAELGAGRYGPGVNVCGNSRAVSPCQCMNERVKALEAENPAE